MKSFILTLCVLYCFTIYETQTVQAQCNHESTTESFFDLGKSLEDMVLSYAPVSTQEEIHIGDSLHRVLSKAKEFTIAPNHAALPKVKRILNKLLPHTLRKDIPYKIYILEDDKNLNAFSLAGGHLYITSKLIDWVETEDELAFIIAHEIAHVDAKHVVRKVQKLKLGKEYFGEYGSIVAGLQMLLSSPFGQLDEYNADKIGAIIAKEAGYNPRKGLAFFERMAKKERYDEYEKMFRTHPYSIERYQCLDDFITNRWKR